MKLLIGLLSLFAVIFIVLSLFTNLKKREKLKVLYLFSAILILVSLFEFFQSSKESSNREVVLKFMQGDRVYCSNRAISKDKFNFVSGTMTFVGKSSENKDIVFNIEDCQVEKE